MLHGTSDESYGPCEVQPGGGVLLLSGPLSGTLSGPLSGPLSGLRGGGGQRSIGRRQWRGGGGGQRKRGEKTVEVFCMCLHVFAFK